MEVLLLNGGKWCGLKVEMILGLLTWHPLPVAMLPSSPMLCALLAMVSFLASALHPKSEWLPSVWEQEDYLPQTQLTPPPEFTCVLLVAFIYHHVPLCQQSDNHACSSTGFTKSATVSLKAPKLRLFTPISALKHVKVQRSGCLIVCVLQIPKKTLLSRNLFVALSIRMVLLTGKATSVNGRVSQSLRHIPCARFCESFCKRTSAIDNR
jgi:hypothetical protein